ncbi:hypothetical protein CBR_g16849 [Chara braunii]|uniref:GDP-D-glucose phosphorylase 1 n=1 Tax=Chara braunii TaxID=69332 RepID=A0A388KTY0_CHABU|nr:hypothetical protein CBR_g16849 [Chara braunii]|eukprot:GBG73506.1 hypothetical protein CBR_g16849 [Chara braunii]
MWQVSPIEYGHVLLVPRLADCIPQQLSSDTFLEALNMAIEADSPFFRVGYNSLGAFATVNHLHFQAYYLMKPFAVERAPTMQIGTGGHDHSLTVYELKDYPVRGLVLELGDSLEELVRVVVGTAQRLQDRNTPFNIFISDKGARVFLYPQRFAERQADNLIPEDLVEMQVNPAMWEISGHIVLKRREDYENITEAKIWRLLAEVSVDEEQFEEVKAICLEELESLL